MKSIESEIDDLNKQLLELKTENESLKNLLKISDSKYHKLIEVLPLGITITDKDGNIIESNRKAEELLGLTKEEQLQRKINGEEWTIITSDGKDFPQDEYASVIALKENRTVDNVEMGIVKSNNQISWINVSASPLSIENFGVVIAYNDITNRKNTENELNSYFINALDLFCIVDFEGKFKKLNKEWENCLGFTLDELINTKFLDYIHPDDYENTLEATKKLQFDKTLFNFTNRYRTKDGTYKVIEWKAYQNENQIYAAARDISERINTELSLIKTNEYLENLINYANAPIIVWDTNFKITRFNHAFEFLTGYKESDVIGKKLDLLFPFDLADEYLQLIYKTLTGERWETVEIKILHKDSSIKTVLWNSATIFDADGITPIATIAQGQDITERKKIEESLRKSNEYLENLINYANAPIIVWDTEFRITRFNHAFEFLTGYTESEVKGKFIDILFPQDLSDDYAELTFKTLSGERWETVEIKILHKDQSIKTVLWNSATLFESDGKTPIGAIAQGQDITERKVIEKAFFENEEKFRLIIENTSQAVFFSEPNGAINFANQEASNMFGYTHEEFKSLQRFGIIDLNDERFPKALKEREIHGTFRGELNFVKKDGTIFPGEITSNLFIDSNGIERTSNIITDISERKLAEKQLKKSQEDLEFAQKIAKLGSWSWDMINNKVSWSKEMFIVFDIDPETYDGNPEILVRRIHPEDLHLFLNSMNSNLERGNSPNLEYRVVHRDGSIHYISAEGRYTFDENGKPIYSVGTAQDISDRKKIEESLRKTNDYLENLINYANAPIIVWDSEFRITRFNHAFEYLTGYKESEVIGKKLDLLFPTDLAKDYLNLIYKTLSGERWETVEIKILHKDLLVKTVLWNSATIFDTDGVTPIATIAQGQDITARKELEIELKQSEEFLKKGEEIGDYGYWVLQVDSDLMTVSENAVKIMGLDTNKHITTQIKEMVLPEYESIMINAFNNAISNIAPYDIEEKLKRKSDGKVIDLHSKAEFDPVRRVLFGTIQNITERKIIEESLRKTNAYLENLINYANAPIIVWDTEFRITRFNHAFEYLTGYKESDVISKKLDLLFPIELADEYMQLIYKTLTGERWETVEIKILHKDKSIKTVLWNSATLFESDGVTPIATIAQGQDITERKLAEDEIRKQEEFLRTLTDNLPGMVGYWTKDLVCKFANKIYIEWFGKSRQEMKDINLKELMNEDLFNLSKPNIDKVLSGEKVSFERTLNKPDGSIGYTWAHYIPDYQDNEVVGFYVLVNDITELKEASIKLEELNNNLQELNATKDKFFSIIAHDLRNPIGSFKQITKLLHESYDELSEAEVLEFLEVMKKSSNNIFTLLENLLEWSKSQSGKLVYDPIDTNLYSMTENVAQLYQSIANEKQVTIVNNIKKTINIFADNNLMSTVFRNLINNSVKFSNANGIVTLDSIVSDDYIQISISDNGVGMTTQQIENLFKIDKSITTLGTKKEKGTGLGLIICKEFVEKHKGKIWVASEVGIGTTFYIKLPR